MIPEDQLLLATVAWKENRGGGTPGMQSIINVVMNRVARHGRSIHDVVMAPRQFTSMSVANDPEYGLDPMKSVGLDLTMWQSAQQLATQAAGGALEDITNGSTLYYAPRGILSSKTYVLPSGETVFFPQSWNEYVVRYQATIAKQLFFTET